MIPVTSSNIKEMGHDGKNMYVKYKNDSIYIFKEVPKDLYEQIMSAPSIGKNLHSSGLKGIIYNEKEDN